MHRPACTRPARVQLCLTPYGCVSTGDELGMLEVVTGMTIANIQGRAGSLGMFKENVLKSWLVEMNPVRGCVD